MSCQLWVCRSIEWIFHSHSPVVCPFKFFDPLVSPSVRWAVLNDVWLKIALILSAPGVTGVASLDDGLEILRNRAGVVTDSYLRLVISIVEVVGLISMTFRMRSRRTWRSLGTPSNLLAYMTILSSSGILHGPPACGSSPGQGLFLQFFPSLYHSSQ